MLQKFSTNLHTVRNLAIFLAFFAGSGLAAAPADPLKEKEEAIRAQMLLISSQLNATCMDCHNIKNFADPSHPRFAKAKAHIEIVEILKAKGFDGKNGELASCTFCHQGHLQPKWLPKKIDKKLETPANPEAPPRASAPPAFPSASDNH